MRFPPAFLIASSSVLLLLFSGFSLISAALIGLGAAAMIIADWRGSRSAGIIGYFLLTASAVNSVGSQGLTSTVDLLTIGFFLVLPLSITLMCALTMGAHRDEKPKTRLAAYARAATLALVVIVSVPLMGFILQSSRFATDVGIESEVMLLGFSTSIMSIIFLAFDSDDK